MTGCLMVMAIGDHHRTSARRRSSRRSWNWRNILDMIPGGSTTWRRGTATASVVGLMVQAIHDDDRILVRRRRTRRVDKQEETVCFSAPRIQTNYPIKQSSSSLIVLSRSIREVSACAAEEAMLTRRKTKYLIYPHSRVQEIAENPRVLVLARPDRLNVDVILNWANRAGRRARHTLELK